jgi:FlaG/FlaF family flagellin (archaellin)
MKGISEILAMVLIIIIVVALIGMTYTFATGLFSTTANVTQTQTDTVTKNMGKSVSIIAATCKAGAITNYTFSLRNTGTNAIASNELAVFVDGTKLSATVNSLPNAGGVNQTIAANDTPAQGGAATRTLKVSAPAGEDLTQVTCA